MNNRRTVLKVMLKSVLGLTFFPTTLYTMNDQTSYVDNLGIQLWTLRNEIEKDPLGTLRKVKDFGYKQLEGMGLSQVQSLKPIVSEVGLFFTSSFFQWTYLTENWDLAKQKGIQKIENVDTFEHLVEMAHRLGLTHLTFGYIFEEERGVENYKKWTDALNKAGELCNEAGIILSYHHHGFEFKKENNTSIFEILTHRLESDLVKFELDTFWLEIAGLNATEVLQSLNGRVNALHLKDLRSKDEIYFNDQIVPHDFFVPVGKGVIDFPSLLEETKRQNINSCFVEQDYSEDTFLSIKESMEGLRKIELR
ncbi:sugar phosphate isomerase/epimerase [Flammeovirga sp. EKP202]|uniref:sugar phosphate isomerase/epimerase family protein n=1 Tax=Flammeovirga sp. EKP202 TaxID=2770592 RepID=UPI00165F6958|nr:sugar phosphate isomerase/epimerase [Flammeovirga sp. EKP202]MBD0403729.1 sugar phosphate isomerase/epimerase [Flammeovirga sp. EKP202]